MSAETGDPKGLGQLHGIAMGMSFGASARLSSNAKKTGFVAFLDVLGFRDIAFADNARRLVEYGGTVETSLNDGRVECVVFSDCLTITREGTEPEDLRVMCEVCSRLMFGLLRARVPIRGAIGFGNFYKQVIEPVPGGSGKSIFLAGLPIIEAYDREQAQNWIGVSLAPTALNVGEAHFAAWKAYLQRCVEIPLKVKGRRTPEMHEGWAVVPGGDPSAEVMTDRLGQVIESLRQMKPSAPSKDKREYAATLKWLAHLPDGPAVD